MKPTRITQEMVNYYTEKGWWDSKSWPAIYRRNAVRFPDKEAFVEYKGEVRRGATWAQITQWIDRVALGFLELGLKKDDMVICQLPNCIENVVARQALERAGLIHVYAAITVREREIGHFLGKTKAAAAITYSEYHGFNHYELFNSLRASGKYPHFKHIFTVGDKVPEGAISFNKMMETPLEEKYAKDYLDGFEMNPYEVGGIMSTTGTTGMPKLVEFMANTWKRHGQHYIHRWKVTSEDSALITAYLWTGPSASASVTLPQVGGTCIIMEAFEPEDALKIIEREKPTYFTGFPVHLVRMAREPNFDKYDTSSFHFLSHGGAPFPAGVADEVENKFGAPLLTYYGTVDSAMTFAVDLDAPKSERLSTQGKVAPWDEFKLLDENGKEVPRGEIGVLYWRGPTGTAGYYDDMERNLKIWGTLGMEGWFNTEDLAKVTEYGNVMLAGRISDMIQRGGQNVYPLEIENTLNAHPKVMQVCIVPMPDPDLGEKACAYVIPKEGETFTFDDMVSYLTEQKLAKYKFPQRLEIVEDFPVVGDKVDKRTLGGRVAKKLLAEGKVNQAMVDKLVEDKRIVLG